MTQPAKSTVATAKRPVDVLCLSCSGHLSDEISRFFRDQGLNYVNLSTEHFSEIEAQLDVIGTVLIDTVGMTTKQKPLLSETIKLLEREHIAVVLLNNLIHLPYKRFSLVTEMQQDSLEELWGRIETNLIYRRKNASNGHVLLSKFQEQSTESAESIAESMAEQLQMAGRVQRDFLPTKLPHSEKFRWQTFFKPAEWVSGDIYDIARLDEHHISFYLADVVGHSMPAALLTIFLKQAIVARETKGNRHYIFEPLEVMQNLNQRMIEQKLSGCQFATCCYCLFNTKTLKLTYARAGHPYPVLIRPGNQLKQLETRGSLLGIFEQAEFEQKTIQLEKKDKLFLYSDGVEHFVGDFNQAGNFNFKEQFNELCKLPADQMFKKLEHMTKLEKQPCEQIDDITAIGLEIL